MPNNVNSAGTVIEYQGKILILHRIKDGFWGLPGGKLEQGETPIEAAIRETWQETGYKAEKEQLKTIGEFKFEFPTFVCNYHAYQIILSSLFEVKKAPLEHSEAKWISPQECYVKPDILLGVPEIVAKAYNLKM